MSTMTATKATGGCGCGGGCGGGCGCSSTSTGGTMGRGSIERPRFFPRQLVTPDDLTLGQEYFRNKLRRMNRYLHGWGVVCGAKVETSSKPWMVIVHPGYILGPYGDEIVIEQDICFDLRTRCTSSGGGDACDDIVIDPLCPDRTVDTRRDGNAPLYIALRYKEVPARPVRVAPVGCGCDDTSCEFSRWQDGYEICVLDACPDSHARPPSIDQFAKPNTIPDCPPCPTDPWVVLAIVAVDGQGKVGSVDNCGCRRMVRTLAPYWWQCSDAVVQAPAPTPAPAPVPPPAPAPVPGTNTTPGRPPG